MELEDVDLEHSPFFRGFMREFDTELEGIDSVTGANFLADAAEFPSLPRVIAPQMLFNLGVYFNKKHINLQRHFWIYVMLQCDLKTYNKFLQMHSKEVRELVSPVC